MEQYKVKDISLAPQGRLQIELAERRMGALLEVRKRFAREKPLAGVTVGMALHVTKETAVLVRTLRSGGAEVAITGCNPLSTQDDVAAALAEEGVAVFAHKGESNEEYYDFLNRVIEFMKVEVRTPSESPPLRGGEQSISSPVPILENRGSSAAAGTRGEARRGGRNLITIDDGGDLVGEIHKKHPEFIANLIGGTEETTTGLIRLRAMERDGALKYPVVAVNDNKTKHLMDNYYGTGQSTLDGITRATNILWAGKTVVVCGYGSCGKGVALRARGMGSNVIVCEVDAFRALQAVMDGFRVMPLAEAATLGDIFITVTGDKHVLRPEHFSKMKSGAILANSGHFDAEIDLKGLREMAKGVRTVRTMLDEYTLPVDSSQSTVHSKSTQTVNREPMTDDRVLYVAGEGRLVNLAAAEGHPSEVMSLSFCGQALACAYLVENLGKLEPKVYVLPSRVDDDIAALQLEAMEVRKDELTEEQRKYLSSWEEGT
ncbi:adenosylhomocysteinase [Candidatus Uhrbacteria bacterium]|nr:adenosylhomocysteinase [Candidatus Uhrbacteria bacterium]